MKKIAIFFLIIVAILASLFYTYYNYVAGYKSAQKENSKFEQYINKEISGIELATVINRAIDANEKNEVEKNEQGKYINNQINSIDIDIKFIEDIKDKKYLIYNLETVYKVGVENLLDFYKDTVFKCEDVQYHKSTGKIKYMAFVEQITN